MPLVLLSRLELVLDQAHNAVISMDERGLVTYWNPSAERTFGIKRTDALGRTVADLIVPERYRDAHNRGLKRFLAEGVGDMLDRRVEMIARRGDNGEIPIEMTITAVHDGSEWSFTAFLQDISERREMERERERRVEELREMLAFRQRRFDAVLGSLAEPITIRNREGRIVYGNRAALTHLGFESVDALCATPPDQIMARYVVLGEDGEPISMDQIPSVRLLRGEEVRPLLIHVIDRETRAEQWNLLKASPLLDAHGEIDATIMVIEDVTEQKRAERRSEFLAQASMVLASSLDYEQTLRNVAHLAVPGIADWCTVDLLDAQGRQVSVAVAHSDPDRLQLAEALRAYEPGVNPSQGLGLVFKTGQAVLYTEITDEMLAAGAADEHHLELLRAVGFRSAAVVPMRIGPRTLGAMTLVTSDSGRVLEQADVRLAEQVAGRAAVAIENSRLYSQRSMIAHTLQQSLRPTRLPEIPGYELASLYLPAFEGSDVGGDFYDVWRTTEGWMVVIGDVGGKGMKAAALTSLVRHTLRATAQFVDSPAELLRRLDLSLKSQEDEAFCTAICLRLHEGQMTLAIGGHPLPFCVRDGDAQEIGEHGPLLGALEDARWHDTTIDLTPGHALLLYTDGVTDAVGSGGERFGSSRLAAVLRRCHELDADRMIEMLTSALRTFQVGEHADDTAALVLRRRP